jgi:hypothetical protein
MRPAIPCRSALVASASSSIDAGGHGWAMEQGYAGPSKEGYMAGFIVAM